MSGRFNVDTVISLVSEDVQAMIDSLTRDGTQPAPPPPSYLATCRSRSAMQDAEPFRAAGDGRVIDRLNIDAVLLEEKMAPFLHFSGYSTIEDGRNASAGDNDLAGVARLDAERRLSRLGKMRPFGLRLVEKPRRDGLVDRKIDASAQRAVLARECQEMAISINDGHVVESTKALGSASAADSICFASRIRQAVV